MFILKAVAMGTITGISASIPLGPAGMESVKRSLGRGFWSGFEISFGAILADYVYIFLIHFGLDKILCFSRKIEGIFWIVSGIILFIFNKLSKISSHPEDKITRKKVPGVLKGFLITFLNPTTPSVWIAINGTIMSYWASLGHKFYFIALGSMFTVTIAWFVGLNLLASKGFKKIATEQVTAGATNLIYYILYVLSIGFVIAGILKLIF